MAGGLTEIEPPTPSARSLRKFKLAAVFVVLMGLFIAQRLGLFHQLSDPAQLTQTLQDLGPWGYVAFIAAYASLQPFGVPGTVFVIAAPLIWPWPIAMRASGTSCARRSAVVPMVSMSLCRK